MWTDSQHNLKELYSCSSSKREKRTPYGILMSSALDVAGEYRRVAALSDFLLWQDLVYWTFQRAAGLQMLQNMMCFEFSRGHAGAQPLSRFLICQDHVCWSFACKCVMSCAPANMGGGVIRKKTWFPDLACGPVQHTARLQGTLYFA